MKSGTKAGTAWPRFLVWSGGAAWAAALAGLAGPARASSLAIATPHGLVEVEVAHAGPGGDLVRPSAPTPAGFTPPSIFSAPLPSGSGARALGVAGAFTALADDATAASWNPGGLTQLERPEVSWVLRWAEETQDHFSPSDDFRAGRDRFSDFNLNYVSAVLPFRAADRNWVASLNYQEVYDFKQQFTADIFGASRETGSDVETRSYQDTVVTGYRDSRVDLTVTEQLTTELSSVLQQVHADDLAARLDFDQEGIISAVSPALAVDLTKTLAVGVALNVYQDGEAVGRGIRSRIRADYEGTTDSRGQITTTRRTTGTYTYEGVAHFEPSGDLPFAFDVPFSGTGEIEPFSDASQSSSRTRYYAEGQYEEVNEFRHLSGVNATFGMLWAVNTHVNLGFAFDLPWTAEATQEKTVNSRLTTYDESRARVLDVTEVRQAETRDVEFDFPAYYAAGLAVKWNHRLYSMLDVSRTDWSRFAFQAEGGEKINPLDGAPYDAGAVDDCWAVRAGTEYVLVFRHTECPLRAGVGWEERPAIGEPDETWSVSGGAGVSLGKGPLKCLLDLSYTYSWAQDALESLVPAQSGMSSDVDRHQVYISMICHF